jgi:hypothetical protein
LPTFILATICGGGIVMSETSRSGWMPPEASQYRIHMACVPGGKVMAKVMGDPFAFASNTMGLSCWGVFTPLSISSLFRVIACPFRLR